MKKLQLKQKITSVIKRFPHYILVGVIALAIATTLVILWLVRSSSATNDYNLVHSYPATPLSDTTFNNPGGMDQDAGGNFYVADTANARIQKFDSDGNFSSQFGSHGSGGGALTQPFDLAIDSSGNIYVLDLLNYQDWKVIKFNSSGTWQASWDGVAWDYTRGGVLAPRPGIAIDSADNIYIGDMHNREVYKYTSGGTLSDRWDIPDSTGGSYSGTWNSVGIAIDSTDKILLSNYMNNRIDEFDTDGNYVGVWASTNYPQDISVDTSDNLYAVTQSGLNYALKRFDNTGTQTLQFGTTSYTSPLPAGELSTPQSVEAVGSNIWAADNFAEANHLLSYNSSGTYLTTLGAVGDGQLRNPRAITLDSSGNLYAVDDNRRVQAFDTSTGVYSSKIDDVLSNASATAKGIARDSSGNIYVASSNYTPQISKYDSGGSLVASWGSSGSGDGQFSNLKDIIADGSGNVYALDYNNNRIQKFDTDGNYLAQWGVTGYPADVDFDSSGNIVVIGGYGLVQVFDGSGTQIGSDLQLDLDVGSYIYTAALDGADNFYVLQSMNDQPVSYAAIGFYGSAGQNWGHWGSIGSGDDQLYINSGGEGDIAVDGAGHVYVADMSNNRVQEYTHDYQLTIDSNVLDDGEVSSAYSDAVEYSGARDNLLFSVTSGNLPDGLVLDTATGAITGTPTVAGNSSFTIQAQDDSYSDTENFTIHISPAQTAPDVETKAADNLGLESADLNGITSPRGVTERGFEYGLTTSYGNQAVDSSSISYTYANKFTPPGAIDVTTNIDGYVYATFYTEGKLDKYTADGQYVETIATNGTGDGEVNYPWGVDTDGAGNIYVANVVSSRRISKFDINGNFVTSWTIPATYAMAVDTDGNVYISDSDTVKKYSTSGTLITSWGSTGSGDGEFDGISAMAADSDDNIYVQSDGRIQKFDSEGNFISAWTSGTGNNNFAPAKGVDVDSQGNVFVLHGTQPVIREYDSDGSYVASIDDSTNTDGFFWNSENLDVSYNDEVYTTQQGQTGFIDRDIYRFSGGITSSISGLTCGTTYHYRAYATNNVGTSYGDDQTFTTDACPQVSIDTATLPDGQVAEAYSQTIATSGGAGTQLFEVSAGSMPSGLALNSANGEITGTATTAGDFTFTISVTDDYSNATQQYTVTIAPLDNPLDISTLNLPDGAVDEAYAVDIDSTNGLGDVTYALSSGSLPTGLTLNQSTGEITGTPTVAGDYDIDITASDDYSTDTQNYTFTIAAAPVPSLINITTTTLVNGVVAAGYSATISSEDGVGGVSYSVVDGALPDGLNLSSGGAISGTPTDPGTFQFTVRATDDNGSDDQVLQIVIYPAQEPSDESSNDDSTDQTTTPTDGTTTPTSPAMYIDTHYLLDGQVGEAYLGQILVKYSSGSLIFTLIDGNLPEGLSLTTTGYISGIPSEAGEYTFSIKAKSDNGSDAEQYTIEVTDDGAETTAVTSASGGSKEEQIAAQTEEISKTNATLADMIESFARRLNITPKQALYGAPWAIVGVFAVFTAVSISQMLAQAKYYQDTKKRQAVHKKLLSEKATFLSLASHYLRTPFTVIKGGIDLAAKTVSDATKGMRDATEKLGEKINDVIERIENENKK